MKYEMINDFDIKRNPGCCNKLRNFSGHGCIYKQRKPLCQSTLLKEFAIDSHQIDSSVVTRGEILLVDLKLT